MTIAAMPDEVACVEASVNGMHKIPLTRSPRDISELCTPGHNQIALVNARSIVLSIVIQIELRIAVDMEHWVQRIPRDVDSALDMSVLSLAGGSEDAVEVISARQSAICPITLTPMTTPAKGSKCKHAQLFDAKSFLALCSHTNVWKCPVCGYNASGPIHRV